MDNEARMIVQPRAHRTHNPCDEPRCMTILHIYDDTAATVRYPQSVDNHVDTLSASTWPSLSLA
jgi:hypothetical protein